MPSIAVPRGAARAVVASLLLALPTVAVAQVTVPSPADDGNCLPFGCTDVSRYQQIYASTAFASPLDIGSLTFFNTVQDLPEENPRLTRGTYQLFLSTTPVAIDGLSDTNLNANRGADFTLFATFVVTGTMSSAPLFTITGATPFRYNPGAGNLLLEILPSYTESRPVDLTSAFLDSNSSGAQSRRAFCVAAGCNSGFTDFSGLVTRFNAAPVSVVPEPETYALMATGLAAVAIAARRRVPR